VAITCEGFLSITGVPQIVKWNREFKGAIGYIDYRLSEGFVKADFNKIAILKLNSPLVARLIRFVIANVYFLAVGLEFHISVFTKKLKT